MPAEFGLATAIFVVVAGMVGCRGADDLGLHGLRRGKQSVDAAAMGLGRDHGGLWCT